MDRWIVGREPGSPRVPATSKQDVGRGTAERRSVPAWESQMLMVSDP